MSGSVSLQKRIRQLEQARADLPELLYRTAKKAAIRAVEAAADATPPKAGTGRGARGGVHTLTGELKAHWAADSKPEPERIAGGYRSTLANNLDYASYVNDGHRMDRHFVPGLYIDPASGLLSYDPAKDTGLVVGTKTRYVKGEFMVDKAKEAYETAVRDMLDQEIRGLLE